MVIRIRREKGEKNKGVGRVESRGSGKRKKKEEKIK